MSSLQEQLYHAQKKWDEATIAYSKCPGDQELSDFNDAKEEFISLQEMISNESPEMIIVADKRKKTNRIYEDILTFLAGETFRQTKEIIEKFDLTKDQARHYLFSLEKKGKIVSPERGVYSLAPIEIDVKKTGDSKEMHYKFEDIKKYLTYIDKYIVFDCNNNLLVEAFDTCEDAEKVIKLLKNENYICIKMDDLDISLTIKLKR